MVNLPFSDNKE